MLWNLHEERNLANFPIQKKKKNCHPTEKQYQNKQDKAFWHLPDSQTDYHQSSRT